MLKLDGAGAVAWQKSYAGTSAYALRQTTDSGYIVAGVTNGSLGVLKLDGDGLVAWQKSYGGGPWAWASAIQQTTDGGYIVAGRISQNDDSWVLKLNADGAVAWQKSYGGAAGVFAIQQTTDGGYILAGSISSGFGAPYVLKLNGDGSVAWLRTYNGFTNIEDVATAIQQTTDGGYIVAGYTYDEFQSVDVNAWVLKLNGDGSVAWQKTYDGKQRFYAIQQTANGGYIVAGYTSLSGAGLTDAWVLKLNGDGSAAWQKTYGGPRYDFAQAIQQTTDGGYVVAGYTFSFGAGLIDAWVLKLSADGTVPPLGVDTAVTPLNTSVPPVLMTAPVSNTTAVATTSSCTVTSTNCTITQQAP